MNFDDFPIADIRVDEQHTADGLIVGSFDYGVPTHPIIRTQTRIQLAFRHYDTEDWGFVLHRADVRTDEHTVSLLDRRYWFRIENITYERDHVQMGTLLHIEGIVTRSAYVGADEQQLGRQHAQLRYAPMRADGTPDQNEEPDYVAPVYPPFEPGCTPDPVVRRSRKLILS